MCVDVMTDQRSVCLTDALSGSLRYLGDFETVNANVYAFVIVFFQGQTDC